MRCDVTDLARAIYVQRLGALPGFHECEEAHLASLAAQSFAAAEAFECCCKKREDDAKPEYGLKEKAAEAPPEQPAKATHAAHAATEKKAK